MDGSGQSGRLHDNQRRHCLTPGNRCVSFVSRWLMNSFSFLPILDHSGEPTNQLISDCSLATYLVTPTERTVERKRWSKPSRNTALTLLDTAMCRPTDKLNDVLNE